MADSRWAAIMIGGYQNVQTKRNVLPYDNINMRPRVAKVATGLGCNETTKQPLMPFSAPARKFIVG